MPAEWLTKPPRSWSFARRNRNVHIGQLRRQKLGNLADWHREISVAEKAIDATRRQQSLAHGVALAGLRRLQQSQRRPALGCFTHEIGGASLLPSSTTITSAA